MVMFPHCIGFTGSGIGMTERQSQTVAEILEAARYQEPQVFHHGDCVGADEEARGIAHRLGYYITQHPPADEKARAFCDDDAILPPKPYLERNTDIVACADLVIAAPKDFQERVRSGTWATVRRARQADKRIIIVWPDGRQAIDGR